MLVSGTRLGPYEIVGALGAGGMGEVYRARDTRLEREVALKVLPAALAADGEFRSRFEREAKILSQLNHSHICTVHDVGRHDDTAFLVMELLQGQTLAEHLAATGALPVNEALAIAGQITSALDVAHRRGVIHRDLKPGNVFLVRGAGAAPHVKLLDFGLATRADASRAPAGGSMAPTAVPPLTATGTILGTLQYMAPEQLDGREADARSDIFAFGGVLYEMLAGRRAFDAPTQASVIGAILHQEPPALASVRPEVTPALDRLVGKCLAKDPETRWQTTRDLGDEIGWLRHQMEATGPVPDTTAGGSRTSVADRRTSIAWATAVAFAIVAIVAVWRSIRPPVASVPQMTRFAIDLPDDRIVPVTAQQPLVALSADGSRLAVVAMSDAGGDRRLYLRSLNELEFRPIRGTERASHPFFSPDGKWIAFIADGQLKRVPVEGGAALPIIDVVQLRGAVWLGDDTIVLNPSNQAALVRVSVSGGPSRPVTHLAEGESLHRWVDVSPDGHVIVFASQPRGGADWNSASVVAQRLDTGEQRVVVQGGTSPRFAGPDLLVFTREGTIMAAPFDAKALATTRPAVAVADDVSQDEPGGVGQFAVSRSGALVYLRGSHVSSRIATWVDRKGVVETLPIDPQVIFMPRVSPTGQLIVLGIRERSVNNLWLYDRVRQTTSRLTFERVEAEAPVWMPDGRTLSYTVDTGSEPPRAIKIRPPDGTVEETAAEFEQHFHPAAWTPAGDLLVGHVPQGSGAGDLWLLNRAERRLQPLTRTPYDERAPALSPDGRWIAYVSNETARQEVYVQPFPRLESKWQISVGGGTEPVWARNGRELFYRAGGKLIAVPVDIRGKTFTAGRPVTLFEGRMAVNTTGDRWYDVASDGEHFVTVQNAPDQAARRLSLVLVQNWATELARPTRGAQ